MTTGSTSASGRGPVDPRVVRGSNVGYFTRQRIEHQKRVSADTRSTVGVARLSPMRPAKSMRRRLKEVFEKVATGEFVAKEDSSEKSSSSSTVGFEENLIEKVLKRSFMAACSVVAFSGSSGEAEKVDWYGN